MVFECLYYADLRQHYQSLFADFDGWRNCETATEPDGADMCTFMQQPTALVAAKGFVHACWLRRCG